MSDQHVDDGPDPSTDPFAEVFGPDQPVTPRAAFAARLRRQIEAELVDLETAPPTQTDTQTDTVVPINYGSLFYFSIPGPDIERSANFYRSLFDWDLQGGRNGYHVANVYPPMGLAAGTTDPQVWIEVDDIEAAVARVRELGGQAEDPVDMDSGTASSCTDPQGVRFNLQVPVEHYRQPARSSTGHGELFYWTLPAPDAAASKAFFAQLFGWEFSDPGSAGGMHVQNKLPDGGLGGGREGSNPELFFRVSDLDAAVDKVRQLGGTAEVVASGPEGDHAMCADDQGVQFGLSAPAAGY